MLQSTKAIFILFMLLLLLSCQSRNDLAPIAELRWQPYSQHPRVHRVRAGETLYAVAFRYDTDFRTLARLNGIKAPYALRVGQILNVQIRQRRPSAGARPVRTYPRFRPPVQVIQAPRANFPSASGWIWPVHGRVSTFFMPEQGKKGINIACQRGNKILASAQGTVAYAGNGLAGYGNLIIIKHNNEYLTAYGNNAKNLVTEGQKVKAGQSIAEAGMIDRTYWGVHFEIRKRGMPVNPLNYLQKG